TEARVAAGLRHPHVVDVLDMGADIDGAVYLVLELLEGETLATELVRRGALPLDACAVRLLPVMDALTAAHARGIVHRDAKPENIYLHHPAGGVMTPKLLDFGIAKVVQESHHGGTATGAVLGTTHYMSPEQAEALEDIGPAADVWAMGVVWYECLAGILPFDGKGPASVLLAITRGEHIPLSVRCPALPSTLTDAIERALTVDR